MKWSRLAPMARCKYACGIYGVHGHAIEKFTKRRDLAIIVEGWNLSSLIRRHSSEDCNKIAFWDPSCILTESSQCVLD